MGSSSTSMSGLPHTRHRRHQALELTAGDLVRVAPAEAVRIGKLQGGVELLRPPIGLLLGEEAMQHPPTP